MSKLLTLDEQGATKLWNVLSGQPIAALVGTKGRGPMASKFSPSGRFVSILTDESIRIWDTQTGQPNSGLLEHRGKIIGSEFNPKTEQFFTLCEDGTARLWDLNPDSTAKETVTQTPVGILETDAAGEHVAIRSTRYGAGCLLAD